MKRSLMMLAVLAFASALSAQETPVYNTEEVLAMFAEYNPAAVQKAKTNADYSSLMNKVAEAYRAPKTPAAQVELIALIKNFDNSIALQQIKLQYENDLKLQQVSSIDLAAKDAQTLGKLETVFNNILQQTLAVKEWQIGWYEEQIKSFKRNKEMDKGARNARIKEFKNNIKALKKEMKELKKNSQTQVTASAGVYLADLKTDLAARQKAELERAQAEAAKAKSSKNLQTKSKNKKRVAK